ncbi:hypothetical protein DTL72_23205 [Escherichia coli]|nr:hypothetical protein DTL38_22915 [Escherichia coli]RCY38795.1 hypothetical protein DTL77_21760 [Escherichia coli]RCY48640.1 hypothetical protein DTL72_23205 [Escherichia coli]RCY54075.1 hypothetical protein DTL40_23300 [Escherichia coli]RCY58647.1 hypothetical protein DTL74_23335 [Escherichia coli]
MNFWILIINVEMTNILKLTELIESSSARIRYYSCVTFLRNENETGSGDLLDIRMVIFVIYHFLMLIRLSTFSIMRAKSL